MANRFLNNITINDQYTLPSSDGSADQVITTDGSGNLSFTDIVAAEAETANTLQVTVKNVSGGVLTKGTVVHVSPSASPPSGNIIEVIAADYDDVAKMPAVGILKETIADDAEGEAVMAGALSGIATDGFTAGDELYVGADGALTNAKPQTAGQLIQKIAVCVKSHESNGLIKIFGAGRSNDVPLPLYIDNTNQRVGIGEPSPQKTLDIDGDGLVVQNSTDKVLDVNAIDGNFAIGDIDGLGGNAFIASADATHIDFLGDGDVRFRNDGYVGIGTTSPGQKLDVAGNIKMTETAATTDTDKFVVLDSGVLKYRTGSQVISDLPVDTRYVAVTGDTMSGNLDVNADIQSNTFTQAASGIPRNNLGSPTVTEMALFDSQFTPKTTLANSYNDLTDLTFWVQTTSSSAWAEVTTYSDDQKRRFLRTNNSSVIIPNGAYKFRVEFKARYYTYANALYMYWSSQSHNSKVHIWKYNFSQDSWIQHTSSSATVSSWPGHLWLPFSTIPWHETHETSTNHHRYIRVEFEPTWSTGQYSDRNILLYGGQIWGGYPSGRRTPHYYDQDGVMKTWESNVFFHDGYHPNADTWTTGRTITIGGTGKTVDGSNNVSWTLSEIGAAASSHNHDGDYVNVTGDTMTGRLVLPDEGFSIGDEYHKWKRAYTVNSSSPQELLYHDGNSLPTGGAYRFHAHISATGTDQSATAVYWNQNGTWKVNVTYQSGTSSNHPEFIIAGSPERPTIHIDHTSNYSIQILGERLELNEGTGTDNKAGFGADAFISSVNGTLRYNDAGTENDYTNGNEVWHAGNDGPSSGLDADTLDGQEGTYYLNYANFTSTPNLGTAASSAATDFVAVTGDTMNGDLTVNADFFVTGSAFEISTGVVTDFGGNTLSNIGAPFSDDDATTKTYVDNALAGKLSTTGKAADSNLLDGIDSSRIVYGSGSRKTNNQDPNTAFNSGFYDIYQTNAPTSTWYSYLTMAHTNEGNKHGHQIAGSFYSDGDLFNRHYDGQGNFGNWTRIWNAANDGPGSGLDADLLDGQHASAFASSSHNHDGDYVELTGDTMSGALTITDSGTGLKVDSAGHASVRIDRGSTSYDGNLLFYTAGTLNWRVYMDGNDDYLYIRDEVSADNVMTFKKGGNVGIGTTNPGVKLDVNGRFRVQDNGDISLDVNTNGAFSIGDVAEVGGGAFIAGDNTDIDIIADGGPIVTFKGSGKVGIGTTSPAAKLDINDSSNDVNLTSTANFAINTGSAIAARHYRHVNLETPQMEWTVGGSTDLNWKKLATIVINDANYAGFGAEVEITDFAGNYGNAMAQYGDVYKGGLSIYHRGGAGDEPKKGIIAINNDIAPYIRIYKIPGSGNSSYQIQVKSPGNYRQIHIKLKGGNGNQVASITPHANDTNGSTSGGTAYTPDTYTNGNQFKTAFPTVTANRGNILYRLGVVNTAPSYPLDVTGTIRATGDVIAYSDIRVKENIKTINNALDKVKALRGVEYNKIDNPEKSIGVIAQEIEEVIPEVVREDDLGMKSVAYGNITAVLIEAIKEQQKQIDELKNQLNAFTK